MFFESFLLNLTVILVLIAALIFDYVTKFFSYWYIRHISFKPQVPFFGSDYHRVLGIRNTTQEVNALYQRNRDEKFFGCLKSRIPDLIVKDPQIIRSLFSEDTDNFNNRGLSLERSQDVCIRNNLFYAEGEKWSLLRDNLDSILKSRVRKFEQIERNVDKYLQRVNGDVKIKEFLENVMEEIVKDLLIGGRPESSEFLHKLLSDLQRHSMLDRFKSYLRSIFPSLYTLLGINTLQYAPDQRVLDIMKESDLIQDTVKLNFAFYANKGKPKERKFESEAETAFTVLCSFMTEGLIPCLNVLTCLFYELSKAGDIQEQARSSSQDSCLDNIISETMRLYPPYSVITRKCIKSYKFSETGVVVDKGVTLTVPIDAIHKDGKYFNNPEQFTPERFATEDLSDRALSFGTGSRECPGKDLSLKLIRTITRAVLRKYRIEATAKTAKKLSFIDYNFLRVLDSDISLRLVPLK